LKAGSLRNIVHLTRLAQQVVDTSEVDARATAIQQMGEWVDKLPDIERECICEQLVTLALSERQIELVDIGDHFVGRIPDRAGCGANRRAQLRKELSELRTSLTTSEPKQDDPNSSDR
jgi:hypothetical protein